MRRNLVLIVLVLAVILVGCTATSVFACGSNCGKETTQTSTSPGKEQTSTATVTTPSSVTVLAVQASVESPTTTQATTTQVTTSVRARKRLPFTGLSVNPFIFVSAGILLLAAARMIKVSNKAN